jgi:hypothetical protein
MPKQYEDIRDSYVKKGVPLARAKTIAAKTWNKNHPDDTNPWNREKSSIKKRRPGHLINYGGTD